MYILLLIGGMIMLGVGIFMFLFALFFGFSIVIPIVGGIMIYLALRKVPK